MSSAAFAELDALEKPLKEVEKRMRPHEREMEEVEREMEGLEKEMDWAEETAEARFERIVERAIAEGKAKRVD